MPTKAAVRKNSTSSTEPSTRKAPVRKKKTGEQSVEFSYYAPEARSVYLAGKFNDWDTGSIPMKKRKDGTWKTTLKLASGRYEYKFFVDGSWAQDVQQDRETVDNEFGTKNNVIGVE